MKTFYKITLLAMSIIALASCRKEYYGGPDMQTVKINVSQNSWQYSGQPDNNYFFATVQMPEINSSVFKKGLVKMYRVYDWDTNNAAQAELPYVRQKEYQGTDGLWYFYTETIDYEFTQGEITLYYSMSDFNYELDRSFNPGPMEFRCVIVY